MNFNTPAPEQDFGVSDDEVNQLMDKFGSEEGSGPTILEDEPAQDMQAAPEEEVKADALQEKQETQEKVTNEVKEEVQKELEYEFKHNGRVIRAPLSKILQWTSQGYDYQQKMSDLKKEREALTQIESTYKPVDEWVKANPDKWDRLQAAIKAQQEGYGDLPADHPILQKISKFETVLESIEQERRTAQSKAEDEALDKEIQSIQEKYKDLDWAGVDADGRTREQAVLEHAQKHGFKTFKTAFLDLYHDELLTAAETRGKEQLAASKEKQAKSGLLQTKGAPNKETAQKISAPKKGKHYPSTDEILAELGLR